MKLPALRVRLFRATSLWLAFHIVGLCFGLDFLRMVLGLAVETINLMIKKMSTLSNYILFVVRTALKRYALKRFVV